MIFTTTANTPMNSVGPNGCPIGYNEEGDLVEWIPDECEGDIQFGAILVRNREAIELACEEFLDKVWWNGHQNWLYRIETGEEVITPEMKPTFETAQENARKIHEKYGLGDLLATDFELGLMNGRLSALAWVLGAEWEESLDT